MLDDRTVSMEIPFRRNVADLEFISDVLLLMSVSLHQSAGLENIRCNRVTLRAVYSDMLDVSESRSFLPSEGAIGIRDAAVYLLYRFPRHLIRMVSMTLSYSEKSSVQVTLGFDEASIPPERRLEDSLDDLCGRFRIDRKDILGKDLGSIVERMRRAHVRGT